MGADMSNAQSNSVLTGNSLVSFSPGTSAEERGDILDCLTYTELRANKKFDRRTGWSKWLNRYEAGLYKNGFALSGALSNNTITVDNYRALPSIADEMIHTASRDATEHRELARLASSALNAMFESDQAQVFFRDWFSTERSESFQVVPCCRNESGHIEVMICGMQMITETVEGSWFHRASALMTVSVSGGTYLYSREAYEPYRNKVESKLAEQTYAAFQNI